MRCTGDGVAAPRGARHPFLRAEQIKPHAPHHGTAASRAGRGAAKTNSVKRPALFDAKGSTHESSNVVDRKPGSECERPVPPRPGRVSHLDSRAGRLACSGLQVLADSLT